MPSTPQYQLPYPQLSDPPNGPQAFQQLATATDAALATVLANATAFQSGLSTARPAPREGLAWFETDTKRIAISVGGVWLTVWRDSGWVNLAYASGWKMYNAIPLRYRRIGEVVHVAGTVTASDDSVETTNGATIATLPSGYRPTYTGVAPAVSQNPANTPARLFINTDGTLDLYTYGTTTTYLYLLFNFPLG